VLFLFKEKEYMKDVVREYLSAKGYADRVVGGGIPYLVAAWERTAASIVAGKAQDWDDYLDAMDGRRILEEALSIALPEERAKWISRVRAADDQGRAHLVPTEVCIWGEANAEKHGYSRERDWWYYHRPRALQLR
jgi:hypothetical protein